MESSNHLPRICRVYLFISFKYMTFSDQFSWPCSQMVLLANHLASQLYSTQKVVWAKLLYVSFFLLFFSNMVLILYFFNALTWTRRPVPFKNTCLHLHVVCIGMLWKDVSSLKKNWGLWKTFYDTWMQIWWKERLNRSAASIRLTSLETKYFGFFKGNEVLW